MELGDIVEQVLPHPSEASLGQDSLDAARAIVDAQVAWGPLCRGYSAISVVPQHLVGYTRSISGDSLIRSVVPFLFHSARNFESYGPARVPIDRLLGDSHKWATANVKDDEMAALETWLIDPGRSIKSSENAAHYSLIAPLGIYCAHEGKNRVQFLRDRGHSHVPAHLDVHTYPAPARLELFWTRLPGRSEVWAVLDRRWVQPILLPELGLRVLLAHGVSAPSAWPSNWPEAHKVAAEIYCKSDRDERPTFVATDLYPLERRRKMKVLRREEVSACILALEDVKLNSRPLLLTGAVGLSIIFLGFASDTVVGHAISFVLLGAVCMMLAMLSAPLMRVRESMLSAGFQRNLEENSGGLPEPIRRTHQVR